MPSSSTAENMAEDDEGSDEGAFEITDFTSATPWESFVSRLENLVHQWGLDRTEDITAHDLNTRQHSKSEVVAYGNRTFTATYHVSLGRGGGIGGRVLGKESVEEWPAAMRDMLDPTHDFSSTAHHISRWYGVLEFVVLTPVKEEDALCSEAQTKLIVSSVAIAIKNTGCCTPVFVQVQLPWRQMYVGVCEGGGVRTSYDMVHLCQTPPPCGHLAGLLDVFKSKIEVGGVAPPTQVTVQFTYSLNHWRVSDWEQPGEENGRPSLPCPLGAATDPIEELLLSTVWPHLTEEVVVDNSHHSDLTPLLAPVWTIRAKMAASTSGLAASRLTNFMRLCSHTEPMNEITAGVHDLDHKLAQDEAKAVDLSQALDKLTQSRMESRLQGRRHFLQSTLQAGVGRLQGMARVRTTTNSSATSDSLAPDDLDNILIHLFPDAEHKSPQSPESDAPTQTDGSTDLRLKSCPVGSLTAHLGSVLCELSQTGAGLHNVVQVWHEFVEELRYRWENAHLIPNLPEGPPSLDACLLHQWLQMLNCCIRAKMGNRPHVNQTVGNSHSSNTPPTSQGAEQVFVTPNSSFTDQGRSHSSEQQQQLEEEEEEGEEEKEEGEVGRSSDEEDKFFEAPEEFDLSGPMVTFPPPPPALEGEGLNDSMSWHCDSSTSPKRLPQDIPAVDPSSVNTLREGVLHPLKDMLLLATGEQLCVPVTQDPGPLTEDMMAEQEHVLSKLGTSEEAAHIRARLQAASLLSDMQAFKAANPGCLLADFVRWYSPRDWEERTLHGETGSDTVVEETGSDAVVEEMGSDAVLREEESVAVPMETGSYMVERGSEWTGSTPEGACPAGVADQGDSVLCCEEGEVGEGDGWEWDVIEDSSEGEGEAGHEEDEGLQTWFAKGHLSERMQLPGNTWVEAWQRAEPVPVSRQKPLFDATQEAEKVLHRLSVLSPAALALQLLPGVLRSALSSLRLHLSTDVKGLLSVRSVYEGLCALLNRVHAPSLADLPTLQESARLLEQGEGLVAAAQSMLQKLVRGLEMRGVALTMKRKEELREASTTLLERHIVSVNKSSSCSVSLALHGLMTAQMAAQGTEQSEPVKAEENQPKAPPQDFPRPIGKEYLLRNILKSPTPHSSPSPQRMFAVITDNEFRLAAAFSRDPNTH